MQLYLAENPRTLYLLSGSRDESSGQPQRILVFRVAEGDPTQAVVEFLFKDQVDLSSAVLLTSRSVKGCLGLISIGGDLFLTLVTSATEIGNTRPSANTPEFVAKIHEIAFYSLTSSTWDDLSTAADNIPNPNHSDFSDYTSPANYGQTPGAPAYEHPCSPLTKILASGSFYYAIEPHWDLSSRLAERLSQDRTAVDDITMFDDRFLWNEYIVRSLLDFRDRLDNAERQEFDRCQFVVLAIQGYVGISTMPLPAPPTHGQPTIATLTVISRLGRKRAGTRFNTRGVDDDGNCANFVETETLFSTEQHCFSYVQVRGSVPLFWEQQGLQTFGHRIQITRPTASQPAFDRHFAQLTDEYGPTHCINLLGSKENEASLTSAFDTNLRAAKGVFGNEVGITHFDFHGTTRVGGHESVIRELRRLDSIRDNIDRFGFSMSDAATNDVITEQKGVFRVNCLDCLDRTNFVEDILSRTALEQYLLLVRREWVHSNALWSHHRELWANNGDALSKIYAGTGALNTSFTRTGKRTLAGLVSDATKSVSRAYINNFQDKSKQAAIDMFLGNLTDQRQVTVFDPIHDTVRESMEKRLPEYSTTKQCIIHAGTWNLNGKPPSSESLLPWLFPSPNTPEPDIFALGFQEIVALTAQQIVQADPDKRRAWERKIIDTLDRRPNKKSSYVLLRSEQLVGTALLVLVKSDLTADIRKVEAATRKTGLRGMSGNKGAVAIRLEFHNTSYCFVTAHLAAGHSNVDERNTDYRTIVDGLHFLKGKTIATHENVVWVADTNYRIDGDNEYVRAHALAGDLDPLLAADQLKQSMDSRLAFAGYEEGPILFRPTYKYNVGTDEYDTSEKMRVPAWTDRILYRGAQLDLALYSCAELKGSDHKPVFALFRTDVTVVDEAKKAELSKLLTESVMTTAPGGKLDNKLAALTLTADSGELPPPSSDENAWWDRPEHPKGVVPVPDASLGSVRTNPFGSPDDTPLSSSPSSSDEELYSRAALQTPLAPSQFAIARKPPPPPPPPRRSNSMTGGG